MHNVDTDRADVTYTRDCNVWGRRISLPVPHEQATAKGADAILAQVFFPAYWQDSDELFLEAPGSIQTSRRVVGGKNVGIVVVVQWLSVAVRCDQVPYKHQARL